MAKKIKILQLITELGPYGAERIVFELATRLPKDEFDVTVGSLAFPGEYYEKKLADAGIPVKCFGFSKYFPFGGMARLKKFATAEKFDIIHGHLFHANLAAAHTARKIPGTKAISTIHICEDRFLPWRFRLENRYAKHSACVVCVSEAVKKFTAKKSGIPEDKLRVIHNGISVPENYEPKPYPEDSFLVGAVGRLDEQKGFTYLLRAMQKVMHKIPQARLVILGDGFLINHLKTVARDLGIDRKTDFPGYVENVFAFYEKCAVTACPSLWEGFGLAAAEAQYAARPVVASDIDSLPEIIENGKTGLLVPAADPAKLADALLKLLGDRATAAKMGIAGYQRASEKFSLGRMIADYSALYRSISG